MSDPEDSSAEASADPAPADEGPRPSRDPLRRSRTSGAWLSIAGLGIVLLLLIIFILQNTQSVEVTFLGWNGHAPLAVTLLIATVAGLFLALVAGSLRILQLRRRVRRTKG